MRFPTHLILDVQKTDSKNIHHNWLEIYQESCLTLDMLDNTLMSYKYNYFNSRRPRTIRFKRTNRHFIISSVTKVSVSSPLLNNLFDINYIKREKLYTKLKYSRSPAYDIVSGGVAAMFAGFIGFLISEKFGIELVDSGDFYTFFMYIVFLVFSCRPLIKILSQTKTVYNFFSFKFALNYIYTLISLLYKSLKLTINSIPFFTHNIFKTNLGIFFTKNEYVSPNFRRFIAFIDFLLTYPNYKK